MARTFGNDWLTQMRKGLWGLCVLKAVEAEACYGYAIVRQLSEVKGLAANETTIYRVLGVLREQGLVRTRVQKSPLGPARRYYDLTDRGRRELALLKHTWGMLRRGIDSVARAASRS